MASVHVQYDSDSDSDVEKDDYLGSDGNPDSTDSAKQNGTDKGDEEEMSGSEAEADAVQLQDQTVDSSTLEESSKSGIADVMAKILGKAIPKNKNPVLARGQTDREIRRRKKLREKESGVVKKKKSKKSAGDGQSSDDTDDSEDDSPEARKNALLKIEKRREFENLNRVKPNVLEKDKERNLQKIATRGVVQLFNAVRQQQNLMGEKLSAAGTSERRRDKAVGSFNKKSFLDLLDSTQVTTVSSKNKKKIKQEKESDQSEKWSILRDDFMMGARMKDWDKEDDNAGAIDGDDAMSDND